MTTADTVTRPVAAPAPPPTRAPARWDRRVWTAAVLAAVSWSAARAGLGLDGLLNPGGWSQVADFFTAALRPVLAGEFVALALREAGVTLAYAVLGTVLSLGIGVVGGVVLAERTWWPLAGAPGRARWGWRATRLGFAVPRSMHEVVFGLLLVNILGLDPLVAVLSIGIPFGAVTAKVFSEMLDEVPRDAERALRAAGAGRLTALCFGAVPQATGDLLSYGFYRFECAIRAAAVLGIVGAGGLGFQIALSFQSLRYEEMWTFLWVLVLISGVVDTWSSAVRRRRATAAVEMHVDRPATTPPRRDPLLRGSWLALAGLIPLAWWWAGVDLTTLWAGRTRELAAQLVSDMWPPQLGEGGLAGLLADSADTVALAVLALVLAWTLASMVAFVARRPVEAPRTPGDWLRASAGRVARFVLLLSRSVPPPVWAFVAVFVFLPGLWPGAIALALYNLGVLGRLQAETVENLDTTAGDALRAGGASRVGAATFATAPAVAGRFVALGLYRWEVAIRETVIVGVVGAAGLGRRLVEQSARFDYDGILATLLALLVVTVAVDLASAAVRRTLR